MMEVVIEKFYNIINSNDDSFLEDYYDDFDENYDYGKIEKIKKAREAGLSVKDISILTDMNEDEILSYLNI